MIIETSVYLSHGLAMLLAGFILGALIMAKYVKMRVKRQLDQVNIETNNKLTFIGSARNHGYMDGLRWVLVELLK